MMEVLFATEYFHPWTPGGSAQSILDLSNALLRAKVGAALIGPNDGTGATVVTPQYGEAMAHERIGGAYVWRFPFWKSLPHGPSLLRRRHTANPAFTFAFAAALVRMARITGARVIHAQEKHAIVGAWMAARALRVPFVVTLRDLGVMSMPLAKCAVRRADAVIGLSYDHASRLERGIGIQPGTMSVIPNAAVASDHHDAEPSVPPLVLFVGKQSHGKGFPEFVAAAEMLPGVRFIAVGSQHGLNTGRVASHGSVADVRPWYRMASVIVQPSVTPEAFSRVPIEAAACRRAVIATAHGGSLDAIRDGETGWLVRVSNPSSLAERITWALDHPAEWSYMGVKAHDYCATQFAPDRIAARHATLYRSLFA